MFLNLVKLNLMRLTKSRASKFSTVAISVVAVLAILLYRVLIIDIVTKNLKNLPDVYWEVFSLQLIIPVVIISVMVTAMCYVTDYYSYRQMINIRGTCKNEFVFCLSEIIALAIYSFIQSFWGIILLGIGGFFERIPFYCFREYPLTTIGVWAVIGISLFAQSLLVYDISRFAFTKRNTVISFVVILLVFELLMQLIRFALGGNSRVVEQTIVAPNLVLADCLMSGNNIYNIAIVGTTFGVYMLILFIAAFISCYRRYEL